VLEKALSAELKPDQKDSDSLPEYAILDPILHAYVEENCRLDAIVRRGFDPETVQQVIQLVDRNEYNRRQGPAGEKVPRAPLAKDGGCPSLTIICPRTTN